MPVSEPSAFPPPRTLDQIVSINAGKNHVGNSVFLAGQNAGANSTIGDLILIGTNVGQQGWTSAGQTGTIAIGPQALAAYPDQGQGATPWASTVIGAFAASVLLSGGRNVIIGDHAMQNSSASNGGVPANDNVVIGSSACQNAAEGGSRIDESVIIGSQTTVSSTNITSSVIVGAYAGNTTGSTIADCILIGARVCSATFGNTGPQSGVIAIGNFTDGSPSGNSVFIGSGMAGIGGSNVVFLGATCSGFGGNFTVVVGDHASGLSGTNNVVIGAGAGIWEPAAISGRLIIETGNDNTNPNERLIFGDFSTGNIWLGQTSPGTATPVGATNCLFLVAGSKGPAGTNTHPYLYVSAATGALHYVSPAGTDTAIGPA